MGLPRLLEVLAVSKCSVEGCARLADSLGHCQPHYMRVQRNGVPGAPEIRPHRRKAPHSLEAVLARGMPVGLSDDECWPWQGQRLTRGYGVLSTLVDGKYRSTSVARLLLGLERGDPRVARHACDNPPCVNPRHLVPGSVSDNAWDAVERGRKPRGEGHAKAKLTEDAVREIRASSGPARILAARFGVSESLVCQIRRGIGWVHVS